MSPARDKSSGKPRTESRRPARRRRWKSILLAVVALCSLLLVATWQVLSHSWFLAPRIEKVLSQLVGGRVTVAWARLDHTGRVEIHGLEVQVPGVLGDPGRLVHIQSLGALVDRSDLLGGHLNLREVEISDAVVRISENLGTGEFNFGHLSLPSTGPRTAPIVLPRIILNSAQIEIGEQTGAKFVKTGTLDVHGELRREDPAGQSSQDSTWYAFDVSERGTHAESLLRVDGRVNLADGQASVVMHGVRFDERRGRLLPSVARKWWDITQPSGALQPIVVQVSPHGHYSVEIIMDGIDWSLPVPGFATAQPSDVPRMTDTRGTIVIGSDGISLVGLSGEVDGVRYRLDGDFDQADINSGFDLTFSVQQFDVARNLSVLTAFPESVRLIVDTQLVQLGGPTGRLDAKIRFQRDAATAPGSVASSATTAQPVHVSGRVELFNADGAFAGFPYPLQGMSGTVEFDDKELRIINVAGSGPDGGRVFLSGKVAPLGPDPSVNVDLYAVNIPLDDTLGDALGERNGREFAKFFDKPIAQQLHDQGVFITDDDVAVLREQALDVIREFRELTGDSEQSDDPETNAKLAQISRRMREYETRLNKPLFNLGGRINVSSTIRRDPGPDQPVRVDNHIRPASSSQPIGILFRDFPYPVDLVGGELLIAYDRIEITKDLVLVGPTGARVLLSGDIKRLRVPVRRLDQHLRVTASDVPIDDLLIHAIPEAHRGQGPDQETASAAPDRWPQRLSMGGRVVAGLHLEGRCVADGRITSDPDGHEQFEFDVSVSGARTVVTGADNKEAVDRPVPDDRWWWPDEHALSDVSAHLRVTRRDVTIHDFTGTHEGETFTARGRVSWQDKPASIQLNANGRNVQLDPTLIDLAGALAGQRRLDAMRGFWSQFEPTGVADVNFEYEGRPGESSDSEHGETLTLTAYPKQGTIRVGGQVGALADVSGSLEIDDAGVLFDDFSASVSSEDQPDGRVTLHGRLGWRSGEPISELAGSMKDARVESPFLRSVIGAVGTAKATGFLDELNAQGKVDADFTLHEQPGRKADFRTDVTPQTLSLDWFGQRFELRNMSGGFTVSADHVRFEELGADYQDGRLGLDGEVTLGSTLTTDLGLTISAGGLTPRVRALLPSAVDRVIDAIELKVNTHFELAEARMQWTGHRRTEKVEETERPETNGVKSLFDVDSVTFSGRIGVEDASLRLSVPITDVDGELALDVSRTPGEDWFDGTIRFDIDRMKLLGRQVTDVQARMETGAGAGQIVLPTLTGRCYGGRISADGEAQLPLGAKRGTYRLDLSLADIAIDPILHPNAYELQSGGARPGDDGAEADGTPLHRSGQTHGRLSIAGELGRVESRRGRGSIKVTGAQLYEVPLAMWALQLSAIALPVSTSFDQADIDFFVDGQTVIFERIALASPSLTVSGDGTLNVDTQSVDLRFSSDARFSIPIVSDIWMRVRDALVMLHVTGTLDRPNTSLESRSRPAATSRPVHFASGEDGK